MRMSVCLSALCFRFSAICLRSNCMALPHPVLVAASAARFPFAPALPVVFSLVNNALGWWLGASPTGVMEQQTKLALGGRVW